MPRPPKPTEQKRRTGNPGKRALPEPVAVLPALDGPPDPPATLAADGRAAWDWVWEATCNWSSRPDALVVSMLCHAVDEQTVIRGLLVDSPSDFHSRAALRALNAEILNIAGRLALSPADRSRLGVAEVQRQTKLEALRARMAEGKAVAAPVARTRKGTKKN